MFTTPDAEKCSACRLPLRMVSSTLGICPRCSAAPAAPIPPVRDGRPTRDHEDADR
jgi:hypothetical protein